MRQIYSSCLTCVLQFLAQFHPRDQQVPVMSVCSSSIASGGLSYPTLVGANRVITSTYPVASSWKPQMPFCMISLLLYEYGKLFGGESDAATVFIRPRLRRWKLGQDFWRSFTNVPEHHDYMTLAGKNSGEC